MKLMEDSKIGCKRMLSFGILLLLTCSSCTKQYPRETVVYDNDFRAGKLDKTTGGILYNVNGQNFLGRYNKGGFSIKLDNIPTHDAIQIEVEPHLHDSWDGNNNIGGIDGPDIWSITADGSNILRTTFSNSVCLPSYCLFQSYPANFGAVNNPPRTEAVQWLPGVCERGNQDITTVYRIVKVFSHKNSNLVLSFKDDLVQTNVANQLCDESWSMGGLKVKALKIE
jgi:hypothetical protein